MNNVVEKIIFVDIQQNDKMYIPEPGYTIRDIKVTNNIMIVWLQQGGFLN